MMKLKLVFALILGIAFSFSANAQTIEDRLDAIEEALSSDDGGSGSKTSLGGYGELHLNAGDDTADDKIDIHRFVIFIGHDYNDNVKFFSEFEIEHSIAGEGQPGEVEMEQMYVDVNHGDGLHVKYGVFLIPVGILNETHEPPTFYGVERNGVEKNIIPTTWWEGGVMISKDLGDGLNFDFGVHSGMEIPTSGKVRSGRQKIGNAVSNNWAFTTRLKHSTPGLEMAFTYHNQTDAYQSKQATELGATLMSAHVDWTTGPFGIRALMAEWDLSNNVLEAAGKGKQEGMYVRAAYKLSDKVGLFARYETYDVTAGDSTDSEVRIDTFGINYYIHPQVVLKADFQAESYANSANDDDVFNLGFGFSY